MAKDIIDQAKIDVGLGRLNQYLLQNYPEEKLKKIREKILQMGPAQDVLKKDLKAQLNACKTVISAYVTESPKQFYEYIRTAYSLTFKARGELTIINKFVNTLFNQKLSLGNQNNEEDKNRLYPILTKILAYLEIMEIYSKERIKQKFYDDEDMRYLNKFITLLRREMIVAEKIISKI